MFRNLFMKWMNFASGMSRFPPIVDPQEFMTGDWNVNMEHFSSNGNTFEKQKRFFVSAFRKNVGTEVYATIYNVTNSNTKVFYKKFMVNFEDEGKTQATLSILDDKDYVNFFNISFQTRPDSSRFARGHINGYDLNYSLTLSRVGQIQFILLNTTRRDVMNIVFDRKGADDGQPTLKWYHVASIIGMFVTIAFMIMQPNEVPEQPVQPKEGDGEDEKKEPKQKKSEEAKKND